MWKRICHIICILDNADIDKLTIFISYVNINPMRKQKSKRCPRCDSKNGYSEYRCSSCGLIFSRVENGSNSIAKGLILSGKSDQTVKARMFPKDVSKKKFLLLCGFLGIWGAHNFYVGRYKKAIFQLLCGLVAVVCVVAGNAIPFYDKLMSFISIPIGIDGVFWAWDFIDGVFNRYKIPVAVDFTKEVENG